MGSKTRKTAEAEDSFRTLRESNPCRPTHCHRYAMSLYWSTQKNGIWFVIFCNLEPIFLSRIFIFGLQVAQVEYPGQTRYTIILDSKPVTDTGQTRYTIILDSKPVTDTCNLIGHGLELKDLAQFLLNAHRAAHRPQKSENWELEF